MSKRDYYEVLGLQKNCSDAEIKKAYRVKAMKYHPDKNDSDSQAEERFKEVGEAYEILKDNQKRLRYDRYGHAGNISSARRSPFNESVHFDDIMNHFNGFSGFNGFEGFQHYSQRRGQDTHTKVRLTLEELFQSDLTKTIQFEQQVQCKECYGFGGTTQTCTRCHGTGHIKDRQQHGNMYIVQEHQCSICFGTGQQRTTTCTTCKGQGWESHKRTIKIVIPVHVMTSAQAGVNGITLNVKGQGNASSGKNAVYGDLLVSIVIMSHPVYQRKGRSDLYRILPITISQSVLGASIKLTTLNGQRHRVEVPAGVDMQHTIKVVNGGLPLQDHFGDLYVQPVLKIPTKLTKVQKKMISQLAECGL